MKLYFDYPKSIMPSKFIQQIQQAIITKCPQTKGKKFRNMHRERYIMIFNWKSISMISIIF
jgi:hypothetical protein